MQDDLIEAVAQAILKARRINPNLKDLGLYPIDQARREAQATLEVINTRATPPAPEWQPISTAPKDRAIYGYDTHYKTSGKIIWSTGEWEALNIHNDLTGSGFYPDYWQPLPQPPKIGK